MPRKLKQYTLDDGSITNPEIVALKTGLNVKNARVRLSNSSDPERVYKPKQRRHPNTVCNDNYKIRSIKSREASIYNEMFVLAFKTI